LQARSPQRSPSWAQSRRDRRRRSLHIAAEARVTLLARAYNATGQ